jgi:multiple sugar transport system substrate-binding protein
MWAYGAHEVGPDGETITVDSTEMRDALKFMKAMFEQGMTPDVFSWDDSSDNKHLVSGVGSWVHDGISTIRVAAIMAPEIKNNIAVAREVAGPAGRHNAVDSNVYAIWKFAQNKPAALAFLEHYAENWRESFVASQGFNLPFLRANYAKPMPVLGDDPQVSVVQDFHEFAHVYGYPGPPNAAAEQVLNEFIIPDMIRRFFRGDSVDEAIRWAEGELRRIYARPR